MESLAKYADPKTVQGTLIIGVAGALAIVAAYNMGALPKFIYGSESVKNAQKAAREAGKNADKKKPTA